MAERNVNLLDRIGSIIPGYIGYAKRDNQRISDKLLRDKLLLDWLRWRMQSMICKKKLLAEKLMLTC